MNEQINKQKYIKWGMFALLISFAIYILIWLITPKPPISNEAKIKLDSLELVIKQKEQIIKQSEVKVDSLEGRVFDLNLQRKELKTQIVYLNTYYNEKIQAVDNYTNDSIQLFFSKRYGQR